MSTSGLLSSSESDILHSLAKTIQIREARQCKKTTGKIVLQKKSAGDPGPRRTTKEAGQMIDKD
jgi:hypothetical protein